MVRRYAAGTAVAAAVVVSLAGCNNSGDDKSKSGSTNVSAAQAVALASQKTSDVKSFKGTLTSSGSAMGQKFSTSGTYQYRIRPDLAMSANLPNINVNGRSVGGAQEVLIGNTMYLKVPKLAQSGGKPWLKFPLGNAAQRAGVNLQQGDPQSMVKMLTASKDVRKVGTESVDGVSTTHYAGSITVREALAKLSAKQRQQAEQSFGQLGVDRLGFDLWTDGKQEPRKVAVRTPSGAKVQTNTTMTFTDFNTPVHISAPPASQVRTSRNSPSGIPG